VKRFGRRFAIALALLVVLRIALPFLGELALGLWLRARGLELRDVELDLALHSGDLRVQRLELGLRASPDSEPLLRLERASFDLRLRALALGRVHLERVAVEGLELRLDLAPERVRELQRVLRDSGEAPREPAELSLDWRLPLRIDTLRVEHLRVQLVDALAEPALDARLECNVLATALGVPGERARLELLLNGPSVLDVLHLEVEGRGEHALLDAQASLDMRGLRLAPLRGALARLGIEPAARELDLRARLALALEPLRAAGQRADEAPAAAAGRVELSACELLADQVEALALDELALDFASLAPSGIELERGTVRGLRAKLGRRADGALRAGGLDLANAPSGEWSGAQLARLAHASLLDPLARAFDAPWSVRELELAEARLHVADEAVEPRADFELQLERARYLDGEPAGELELQARAPGLCESLRLAGPAKLLGESKSLDVQLEVSGIALEAARAHLARFGCAPAEVASTLRARLQASAERTAEGATRAQAELSALELRQGEQQPASLALERVRAAEVLLEADSRALRIGELELYGLRTRLERGIDGAWRAFGLRTLDAEERAAARAASARVRERASAEAGALAGAAAAAAASPTASAASAPAAPAAPAAHTRFELGSLHVHGGRLEVHDEASTPPIELALEDELRLSGFVLDADPRGASAPPAALELKLRGTGLEGEWSSRGTLASRPGPLALQLELETSASLQSAAPVAPWLAHFGLRPQLEQAALAFRTSAALSAEPDGLQLELAVRELEARSGDTLLARLASLAVQRAHVGARGLEIAAIELDGAHLRVEREASGAWCAAGFAWLPRAEDEVQAIGTPAAAELGPTAASQPAASQPPASQPAASSPASAPAASQPRLPSAVSPRFALGRLRVSGAELLLLDRSVRPALEVALRADLELDDWIHEARAEPASWRVALTAAPLARALSAQGSLSSGPEHLGLRARFEGEGLELEPLAAHLPTGWHAHAMDASVHGALEAQLALHPLGGRTIALGLRDFELRAPAAATAALALRELVLRAPRIDAGVDAYEIDALALSGLELELSRTRDRGWRALGLELGGSGAPPVDARVRSERARSESTRTAPPTSGARTRRAPRPELRLGSLLLELERCAVRDEARPDAQALQGALRIESRGPLELAAPRGTEWALEAHGSLEPLLGGLELELRGSDWLRGPRLAFELAAHGIDADALAPWLENPLLEVRGSDMPEGELRGRGELRVFPGREAARAGWWRAPFGFEAELAQLELRRAPAGELLAGLGALRVEARLLDFAKRRCELGLIELENIAGRLARRLDGWHALGLALNPRTEEALAHAEPESGIAPAPFEPGEPRLRANDAEPEPEEPLLRAAPEDSVEPLIALPFEFELGELVLSGLDFELSDERVDPPARFPLRELHAEVRQLGTRALRGEQPVRFQASVGAASVALPPRGVERPAFEELAVRGSMRLAPEPRGWMRLSATGVELLGAASLARERGLEIGGGLLDAGVRVRVRGLDEIDVRSSFAFSELSLSEQSGGPIESVLQLPAPLDVALFALRDSDGEIDVPLSFELRSRRISGSELALAAAGATTSVVANAIASSPLRLAGGLTGLLGFGGDGESEPESPSALAFAPGATALENEARAEIEHLVKRLASNSRLVLVLEHELSPVDVARAELLANPGREHCLELAAALRAERARLADERERVALQPGSVLVHDAEAADERAAQLRALDARQAELERALDGALELVRPGAARFRDRRTRAACVELGRARLEAVRAAVLEALPTATRRVELRSPKMRLPAAATQPSSASQPTGSTRPSADSQPTSETGRVVARLRQRSN